jgi:hypothetical protein
MTIVDDKPLTEAQVQDLVTRAGMLLRFRPVPGSDPKQAKMWLQSVAEYLASEALRQALRQLGVPVPGDAGSSVEHQAPALDHLAQLLDSHDSHEDNPVVVGLVFTGYLALAGYAIYWNLTHQSSEGEHPDGGTPVDAGSPVDGGASG